MLAKKGSVNTITSPKHSCLPEIIKFLSLGSTVLTIVLPTQIHFLKLSHSIWLNTGHVESFCLGTTFQLPQQTVIRIKSQGVLTKCSSFQISHLIVTVKFTPFWGYLQLDHPVTCGNIKCYSHIQIITCIKISNFLNNLLPLIVPQK